MEEVQEGLFKDFCFFLNILDTWKICPDSWLVLGQAWDIPYGNGEDNEGSLSLQDLRAELGILPKATPQQSKGHQTRRDSS